MPRVVLIQAGPTKWDLEDRLVGDHPLPLTELGVTTVQGIAQNLGEVAGLYRCKANEACEQAAKIVAAASKARPSDVADLEEIDLGLWQGLTRKELRYRHPKVFPQWEEDPLSVNPPDGQTVAEAIERMHGALKRLLRRRRAGTLVLCLRPMVMQIALGLLQHEDSQAVARHLQNSSAVETIPLTHEELLRFVS